MTEEQVNKTIEYIDAAIKEGVEAGLGRDSSVEYARKLELQEELMNILWYANEDED